MTKRKPVTKVCSIDGCGRRVSALGYCGSHYRRTKRYGHPMADVEVAKQNGSRWTSGPPLLRYFTNLDWSQTTQDGCWIWGGKTQGHYPAMHDGNGCTAVHRWVVRFIGRVVPSGSHVDHLCRNKRCVNPAHLEVVPNQVNILRGMAWSVREKFGLDYIRAEMQSLLRKMAHE